MAQASGFEYDIFISYAHDDNCPIVTGQPGWVDEFHGALNRWLKERRGLSHLAISRDRELDGSTVFDVAIKNRIKGSALFFVLHSRNYTGSEYCRQELEWFYRSHAGRFGGLMVGERSRLFHILLNNIPYTKWPKELSIYGKTSGFPMHDAESDGVIGDATDPSDERFTRQLRRIVDAAEAALAEFPHRRSEPDQKTRAIRAFVADVADSLRGPRERIVAELKRREVCVIEGIPPPWDGKPHEDTLKNALASAHLSIHLLNEWAGRPISDRKGTSYPRAQVEIALECDVPKLIWVPRDLELDDVEDEKYRSLLHRLANGDRGSWEYEYVQADRNNFLKLVLEKANELQRRRSPEMAPQTCLVDTHQKDQRYAFELATYLSEQGVVVDLTQELRSPSDNISRFLESVQQARNLIILFGKVDPAWLRERVNLAVKAVSEQLGAESASTLQSFWIYLVPRNGYSVQLPDLPRIINIRVGDNTHSQSIEPEIAAPLIKCICSGRKT